MAFFSPTAGVEAADPRPGLAEAGVFGGDGQVAHQMQHVAAADRPARDHGHHRLGQGADHALKVEGVEVVDAGFVLVAAVLAPDLLVAPGAEGLGADPGEDDHPHRLVEPGLGQRRHDLVESLGAKRVVNVGPVDGDAGDAVGPIEQDVAERGAGNRLPVDRGLSHRFNAPSRQAEWKART